MTSLLSFNLGVELGQLAVLAVLVPALNLLFRYVVAERIGTIILSALVAHTAWHWMLERADTLSPVSVAVARRRRAGRAMRWLMAALVMAALVWLANKVVRRWLQPETAQPDAAVDQSRRGR